MPSECIEYMACLVQTAKEFFTELRLLIDQDNFMIRALQIVPAALEVRCVHMHFNRNCFPKLPCCIRLLGPPMSSVF